MRIQESTTLGSNNNFTVSKHQSSAEQAMGSPMSTKDITDTPVLKRDRVKGVYLPEEGDPLTHRASSHQQKQHRGRVPYQDSGASSCGSIAVGRFTWGRRILRPCWVPVYSQTSGHTHLWSAWGGRWPQCMFMSLKINLDWKCLLDPSLSVVPLLVSLTLGMSVPPPKLC